MRGEGYMLEKYMVNDILENSKHEITNYTNSILECSNIELRQTIQSVRNTFESFQYELFKVAQTKGYYQPAQKATVTEVQTVKTQLQQG